MPATFDDEEGRKAIKEQIEALKKQHREAEIARRKALQEQMRAFMEKQREQDEAHKKAIREQIETLKKQFVDEHEESKRGLREQIVEKMELAREEHVRKHHSNRARSLELLQDRGDSEVQKGFLKLHILMVLSDGPSHGYEIMHRISHHTMRMWRPSPGSLYPALEALESKGFIACQGDGRRKVYSLTSKGQNVMEQIRKKREEQFYEMKSFMSSLLEE